VVIEENSRAAPGGFEERMVVLAEVQSMQGTPEFSGEQQQSWYQGAFAAYFKMKKSSHPIIEGFQG
jgi:hypothetical protein